MKQPQRCPYLLVGGMSVICKDSFSPSRCMCNHNVCPECWGIIPTPAAAQDLRLAFRDEDMAFKDAIIEQQTIHINTLNAKMVEMMQGAAKAEREQAAKRVDAFADSLHDLESIVIKGGLRELAESLRGGGAP